MRLTELEPQFVRYEVRTHPDPRDVDSPVIRQPGDQYVVFPYVDTLEQAQGVDFLCPLCFVANGGPVGTHHVLCWSRSRGVPDDGKPGPGRWLMVGTGYHDLTLEAEPGQSRSVLLTGSGCGWHGFITNGEVTNA